MIQSVMRAITYNISFQLGLTSRPTTSMVRWFRGQDAYTGKTLTVRLLLAKYQSVHGLEEGVNVHCYTICLHTSSMYKVKLLHTSYEIYLPTMYSSKEHLDFYSSKIMLVNILL
jgi:hypothetical protein